MEEHQTFGQRRWPLHFALAWVLTRDPAFSERAKPSDFHPHLNEDEDEDDWISGDEVDQAWSLLHQALAGGSVPAFKTSKLCGNSDAQVGEAGEERIAPEALASIDWADLIRDDGDSSAVVVSSSAMISFFPPGGNPVAFTSDHIGPPIRPDGPGYMALSDAAYWIATEGGTKRIVMRDVSVWKGAFAELLRRVQSGQVHVVGRRGGASLPETIDGASFVGLPIGYPYTQAPLSMIAGEKPHIECCGVLFPETDEADRYSDKLWGFNRQTPEWTHLQVRCSDINAWWLFAGDRRRGQAMAAKVFISYRRDDSAGHAGRVHDRLEREFGRDLLFMDVDSIPLGTNFVKVLGEEVAKCDALLALIGPGWLDARDENGNRRLENPDDFVRIEIATALKRDIPVIPIRLEGTRVPKADQLPDDLKELTLRNGLDIRHASFPDDMERLIRGLKGAKSPRQPAPPARTPDDQVPVAPSRTATPAPPAPLDKPRRNFVDAHVTPEYLVGLYQGNTALRAETLISEHLGRWLQVSGPLGEVHPGFNAERSPTLVAFEFQTKPVVYMWFSGEWVDRLALLPKTQNISVVGQLEKVTGYNATVELKNCELMEPD
jgi:TIR domain